MKEKINFEYRKVSDLIPYIRNAKIHTEEQVASIAASIREFGTIAPIVIDENNTILAGHGRLKAAMKLGLTEVPTVQASHLTAAQKKAYTLADNRTAEQNTGWDTAMLALELKELEDLDFNFDEIMDFDDIDFPEEDEGAEHSEEDLEQLPEDDEIITRVHPGDVWLLGDHKLICGDSTKRETYAALLGEERADLVLTDPPYNVDYEGKTKDKLKIQNDKKKDDDFFQFLFDFYSAAIEYTKAGGACYIWHADSEGMNFRKAMIEAGWLLKQCCIWVKNTLVMGRQDFHWRHEPCLYSWKPGAAHNWYSDRKQTTVWEFDRPSRSDIHPTMKPVKLFQYQIECSSKRGDIVLDPFSGSGTTIIACEDMGRKARGIEFDPKYCDRIIKRWEDLTGKEALLES